MVYKVKKIVSFLIIKFHQIKRRGVKIKTFNCSKDLIFEDYVRIPKKVIIKENCRIGKCTYLSPHDIIESNVTIGKYCSIAPNVYIGPGEHYKSFKTTHPILFDPAWRKIVGINEKDNYYKKIWKSDKSTLIGNDVWIGINSIVMRGVKIGDGAIIGAGSIVTKDVEPYSINVDVPSKTIGYRFDKKTIVELQKEKWWENDLSTIDLNSMYNSGDTNEN